MIEDTTPGRTAKVIGRCTAFKNGEVKWGLALDGADHVGIDITQMKTPEGKVRAGCYFRSRTRPLWWTDIHRVALDKALRDRVFNVMVATTQHPFIQGTGVHDNQLPEMGSK